MKKILAIILLCLPLSGCWNIEKGQKVGQIVDVSQKGVLINTWECKLIRGGLDDGSGSFGQSIWLTIENDHLVEKAKTFMKKKTNIILDYHQEALTLFRSDRESKSRFIDSIDEIKKD